MSHKDYIAKLGIDQLDGLIAAAKSRMTQLQQEAWVEILTVTSDDGPAWFAMDDYAGAVAELVYRAESELPTGFRGALNLGRGRQQKSDAEDLIEYTAEMLKKRKRARASAALPAESANGLTPQDNDVSHRVAHEKL